MSVAKPIATGDIPMKSASRKRLACAAPALFALAAGVAVAQVTAVGGTPEGAQMKNPVPATEESVTAGRATYVAQCAVCHGERGDGHGQGVGDYGKPPADLTRPSYTYGTSDGDVFDVIQNGVQPRLAMPAWDGIVSESDIWNLVNYLRTLRSAPPERSDEP